MDSENIGKLQDADIEIFYHTNAFDHLDFINYIKNRYIPYGVNVVTYTSSINLVIYGIIQYNVGKII